MAIIDVTPVQPTLNAEQRQELDEMMLKINNGDLVALKEIQQKWRFKNIESILRFAIAVLVQAEKQRVFIDTQGKPTALEPTETLLSNSASTHGSKDQP